MRLLGHFHNLAGGLVIDHKRESSLAVETVEFLVQQNIMIGFLHECAPMTSGSLDIHFSTSSIALYPREYSLGIAHLIERKIITIRLIAVHELLQLDRTKLLTEMLPMGGHMLVRGILTKPSRDVLGVWDRGAQRNKANI